MQPTRSKAISYLTFIGGVFCLILTLFNDAYCEQTQDKMTVYAAKGIVEVSEVGGEKWAPLKIGDLVRGNQQVRTGEQSELILQSDYSAIRAESNTELKIGELSKEEATKTEWFFVHSKFTRWDQKHELKKGEVYIHVKPKQKGSKFIIETETAVMAVRGTFFRVIPDQASVFEGALSATKTTGADKGKEFFLTNQIALFTQQGTKVRPLSPVERDQFSKKKQTFGKLIAQVAQTNGALAQELQEAGEVPGPYIRDHQLSSWKANIFFVQNGHRISDKEKWSQIKNLAQTTNKKNPSSSGIHIKNGRPFGEANASLARLKGIGSDGEGVSSKKGQAEGLVFGFGKSQGQQGQQGGPQGQGQQGQQGGPQGQGPQGQQGGPQGQGPQGQQGQGQQGQGQQGQGQQGQGGPKKLDQ